MEKKLIGLAFSIAVLGASTAAQTTVTNSNNGTTNAVPVYTGSATLGNSPISVSGSNVGIGTTAPDSPLTIKQGTGLYPYMDFFGSSGGSLGSIIDIADIGIGWSGIGINGLSEINHGVASGVHIGRDAVGLSTLTAGWSGTENAQGQLLLGLNSTANPHPHFFIDGSAGAYVRMGVSDYGLYTIFTSYPIVLQPSGGSVGIGTTAPGKPLDVSGTIRTSATGSDTGGVVYPDGTQQTTAWTGVLCGGDYAEAVDAKGSRKSYEPGDVLVIGDDSSGEVQKSAEPYSTMVAGIFATKPGVIGRRQTLVQDATELPMAMIGIVPTKVSTENGPIHRGDLLVTSSRAGYAMKGTDHSRMLGAVIGKAMEPLNSGTGVIAVLVTLQ